MYRSRETVDPVKAVRHLSTLYKRGVEDLRQAFADYAADALEDTVEAYYPQITIDIKKPNRNRDNHDSFGFMSHPGKYSTTITRPDLFREYLIEQLSAIRGHHPEAKIRTGYSTTPMPIHFAIEGMKDRPALTPEQNEMLEDYFTVPRALMPDLDNRIADGHFDYSNGAMPLSLFAAPRVDKSLAKISYYTGTDAAAVQGYICFTNYQAYVDRFEEMAMQLFAEGDNEAKQRLGEGAETSFIAFVGPGNVVTLNPNVPDAKKKFNLASGKTPTRMPQMPGYHLVREDGQGMSLINIGVGPSNAMNMTDRLAVLRPHAFFMLGHCAGLTRQQALGDYVLANAYSRRDGVLDEYVPLDTPIPALAEIQLAIRDGIGKATGLDPEEDRNEIKKRYRTGTVVSEGNRNWEEDPRSTLIRRFTMSRAIGLDMESATIAANGFRYRIPYGTLLCVSDKPLTGEIKMQGMVNEFYQRSVGEHFWAGIHSMEAMRNEDTKRIHSRKLRSPFEVPFR
jgi:AMP nucleosidase